jgi:hypothetical protein
VNGDGKPDIITTNYAYKASPGGLSVLLGNGDGTFRAPESIATNFPHQYWLAVADVNGDGKPDIITANAANPGTLNVLLGNGNGTFQPQRDFASGPYPEDPVVADINGDGIPDIIVDTSNAGGFTSLNLLLGKGDGTFAPPQSVSNLIGQVAVADVNGDGKPDIVIGNGSSTVKVLLGNGAGSFTPSSPISGISSLNIPYLADLTGEGFLDSVVLDRFGNILFRKGLPGADNLFAPPVVLNSGRPSRALTVVKTGYGWAVAAADARFEPTRTDPSPLVATVSLYTIAPDGNVSRTTAFTSTLLPTRIVAADLTRNGLDDLVVANSLDNSIQVAFQQLDGTFSAPITLPTGEAPSDISIADLNGDGLSDLAVTNQVTGDVSVFLNDPTHSFATSYRFRSGTGLYEFDNTNAGPAATTLEQSVALAAGDFTGSGRNDLAVVNRGTHSFTVLPNDGAGGFGNPQAALTTSTSDATQVNQQPGQVVAGDFNGVGLTDLAVLMQDTDQVWIYTNQGEGTFLHTFTITAGTSPTGLNLFHNPRTGQLDVLVGNQFGDVLHLQGKGDGTFQLPGSRTSLDVQDLGNGKTDVLVANQRTDSITVQASPSAGGGSAFAPVVTLADGTRSTLAPGNVYWAKLDKNSPYFDAVVVASGGNAVLVYRGTGFDAQGAPTFAAPVSYSVGTDPVSITIADINGDGIPDMLVADQGSNDVAELFGAFDSQGHWIATAGPRLNSGGSGPIAVNLVADAKSPGGVDLAVTNGLSGTVAMLPGRGQGFFDDRTPQIVSLDTPVASGPVIVGGEAVFPTLDGALVGFDLATLGDVHTVFDSTEVSALGELPDGEVAVANADGNVDVLRWDSTLGLFELEGSLSPLSGLPSDPSALAVLQSDNGLRVLVTQAGSNALFVFAGSSIGPSTASPTATVAESVPLPLPTGLAVVLTLLPGSLPLDTVPPALPTEQAALPTPSHSGAESGGSDQPDEPEEPSLFVPPFAGPNPIEALEKIRLFGPQPSDNSAPAPDPGPKKEPPPMPQGFAPLVAPRDLAWSDVSWLESASRLSVAEDSAVPAEMGVYSMVEDLLLPSPEGHKLACDSPVIPAFALLGLVGLQGTRRHSSREDDGLSDSSSGHSRVGRFFKLAE